MFQLFQKSFHFAVQELQERCWFWYKTFMRLTLKLLFITIIFVGIPICLWVLLPAVDQYVFQKFSKVLSTTLSVFWWFLLPGSFGFCLYHLIIQCIQVMTDWFVIILNASYDQNSKKLSAKQSNLSFLWIFLMVVIPLAVGKNLIMVQTGSKMLGELVGLIIGLFTVVRIHFAYFIALENSTNADSFFQIALVSIKQSLKLTRGKFLQLLFIALPYQALSIFSTMAVAFDVTGKVFVYFCMVGFVLTLLAAPFFALMHARAYVLLSQEK